MNFKKSKNIWTMLFYSLLAIDLGLFGVIGWLDFAPSAQAQTSSQYPDLDKNGKPLLPRPGPQVVYSPADLVHNAVTLPGSTTIPTANTNIVRLGLAKEITYFVNCTQPTNVSINVYTADDQAGSSPNFALYGTYVLFNGVAAQPHQIYVGTELAPTATSGTLSAAVLPPRLAVSFFAHNTRTAPGTFTGR